MQYDSQNKKSSFIKQTAAGQWPSLLRSLGGLSEQQIKRNKATSCPVCGGTDRFSYWEIFKKGNRSGQQVGAWFCRHCCPKGADGFDLLMRIHHWDFPMALGEVSRYLGIDGSHSDPEKLEQIRRRNEARAAEQSKQQQRYQQEIAITEDQRADYARQLWLKSPLANSDHPYLVSHRLPPFNLRQHQHPKYGDCLLVPLINEKGVLRNIEYINPQGQKRCIKGAQKHGCFYWLNPWSMTIYIAEGWATAAALTLISKKQCSVVMPAGAGLLLETAGIVRRMRPASEVVIATDNDASGLRAAIAAAKFHGLQIIQPPTDLNDFCDVHIKMLQEKNNES